MANEFKVKNGLLVSGSANINASGSAVFTIDGTAGRLFTVDDTTSGSLFSVNTSAGLPIIEAFSDNTVRIGQFGQRALFVSQSKVGINKESALNGLLDVSGSLTVTGSVGILGAVSASSYTGSLLGTASFATSASWAPSAGGSTFPFTGSALITGSLGITGSLIVTTAASVTNPSITISTIGAAGGAGSNLFIGTPPTTLTSAGINNVGIGRASADALTSGAGNMAIGLNSLSSITAGSNNVAIGLSAIASSGGAGATQNSGSNNVAIGTSAMQGGADASHNVAIGAFSMQSSTSDDTNNHNTAVGSNSGRYYGGSTSNTLSNSTGSVFIGAFTYGANLTSTNEIVIGANAIGNGNNSITLGNTNITKTILRSGVGIGTTSPTTALHAVGQLRLESYTTTTSYAGTAVGVLAFDATGSILTIATPGGGSGSPGGANTTIQFNDGGAFSGSGNFVYNKATDSVGIRVAPTSVPLRVGGSIFTTHTNGFAVEDSGGSTGFILSYNDPDATISNNKNGLINYSTGLNNSSTSGHLWNLLGSQVMVLNGNGNLGIGTGIDPFDPLSYPKAKLYVQDSGSTILLISGSAGNLLRVVDSGSNFPIIAVFSSGSRNTLTITTSSVVITGSAHIEQGSLVLDAINDPAPPSTDTVAVYAKNIGGRMFPKWIGPSGVDTPFQPNIMFNNISFIVPGGGTTITQFGCTTTAVGTVSHPTLTSTNLKSQTRRFTLTSTATAGASGSVRVSNLECWRGNAAGFGGFFVNARFGLSGSLPTNVRSFVGLLDSVNAIGQINPMTDTTLNKIGMAITSSTNNWQIIHNAAGSTPTLIPLGGGFPADGTTLYELVLYSRPSGSQIDYRVTNLSSSLQVTGSLTTNIPAATTFLARYGWVTNGGTAAAASIDISRFSLESDY